jgi:hypothetical protein
MTFRFRRLLPRLSLGFAAAALLALTVPAPAPAHETDNYTLPVGRQFADIGPWLTRVIHGAVQDAVTETNAAIEQALAGGATAAEVAPLQSPEFIAGKVWEHIFVVIPTNELLDAVLLSEPVQAQYPGLVTMYRPPVALYDDPLLAVDLTKAVRTFFRAGTVHANGVEFGTDKLIHFINVGRIYHADYVGRVARGADAAAASQAAILHTARNPLTSEDGMLGIWTTGIHSNGDLAADFAGLLFYRNLTEGVTLGPRTLPPILVRSGPLWRLQASADSDFFTAFITPHWNEVLNPNRYIGYYSPRLRTLVAARCHDVVDWYRDSRGERRDAAQFDAVSRELATYFGVPYGHEVDARTEVTVSRVCFDRERHIALPDGTPAARAMATAEADALGRSALWWAARAGDADAVRRLARTRAAVNAADVDGETPLHAAVRAGSAETVAALLAAGADPDARALYAVTPLMLATARGVAPCASVLLAAGADPNGQDVFGSSALHAAVRRGSERFTALLVAAGADPHRPDGSGRTAFALARAKEDPRLLAALGAPTTTAALDARTDAR